MDLTPGAVIAGRYRVERKVGSGGMGEVWAGEHRLEGIRVAIKTLLPAAACNHEVVARFKREAFILGRIRSDHVARVVDFVADDDYGLVLVMEFIEGDSLSRVLTERVLSVEETIDLGVDIACALVDLHEAQTVHRDLKPGNIILQPIPGDTRRRAVVVDFGVSRLNLGGGKGNDEEEITGITRADMAVGTIEYMAPEQILNSRNVTSASDIYAAGAILFRAAAGRHVFGNTGTDAQLANKKLTTDPPPLSLSRDDKLARGLAEVVMRALKRRPSERYKTAQQLLDALIAVRDSDPAALVEAETTKIESISILHGLMGDRVHMRAQPQAPLPALEPPPSSKGSVPSSRTSAPPSRTSGPPSGISGPPSRTSGPPDSLPPEAARASMPRLPSQLDIDIDITVDAPKPRRRLSLYVLLGALLSIAGGFALKYRLFPHQHQAAAPPTTAAEPEAPAASSSASAEPTQGEPPATAEASAAPPPADATAESPAASSAPSSLAKAARPPAVFRRPAKPTTTSASPSESVAPQVKPADPPDAETSY